MSKMPSSSSFVSNASLSGQSCTLFEYGPEARKHKPSSGSTGFLVRARTPGTSWTSPFSDISSSFLSSERNRTANAEYQTRKAGNTNHINGYEISFVAPITNDNFSPSLSYRYNTRHHQQRPSIDSVSSSQSTIMYQVGGGRSPSSSLHSRRQSNTTIQAPSFVSARRMTIHESTHADILQAFQNSRSGRKRRSSTKEIKEVIVETRGTTKHVKFSEAPTDNKTAVVQDSSDKKWAVAASHEKDFFDNDKVAEEEEGEDVVKSQDIPEDVVKSEDIPEGVERREDIPEISTEDMKGIEKVIVPVVLEERKNASDTLRVEKNLVGSSTGDIKRTDDLVVKDIEKIVKTQPDTTRKDEPSSLPPLVRQPSESSQYHGSHVIASTGNLKQTSNNVDTIKTDKESAPSETEIIPLDNLKRASSVQFGSLHKSNLKLNRSFGSINRELSKSYRNNINNNSNNDGDNHEEIIPIAKKFPLFDKPVKDPTTPITIPQSNGSGAVGGSFILIGTAPPPITLDENNEDVFHVHDRNTSGRLPLRNQSTPPSVENSNSKFAVKATISSSMNKIEKIHSLPLVKGSDSGGFNLSNSKLLRSESTLQKRLPRKSGLLTDIALSARNLTDKQQQRDEKAGAKWIPVSTSNADYQKVVEARETYRRNSQRAKSIKNLDFLPRVKPKDEEENIMKGEIVPDEDVCDQIAKEKLKFMKMIRARPMKQVENNDSLTSASEEYIKDFIRVEELFRNLKLVKLGMEETRVLLWRYYVHIVSSGPPLPFHIREKLTDCYFMNNEDLPVFLGTLMETMSRVEYCQHKASWRYLKRLIVHCERDDIKRQVVSIFGPFLVGDISRSGNPMIYETDQRELFEEIIVMSSMEGPFTIESHISATILDCFGNLIFKKTVAETPTTCKDVPFVKKRLVEIFD